MFWAILPVSDSMYGGAIRGIYIGVVKFYGAMSCMFIEF